MIEDFEEKVPYTKRPLSIKTQVAKLEKRGLIIDDENLAGDYLSNISYYRLRAYTYPFKIIRIQKLTTAFYEQTFILKTSLIYIVSTGVCVL